MELDAVDSHDRDGFGRFHHMLFFFMGEPENDMGADLDPSAAGRSYGRFETMEVMTPVDQQERSIMNRLQPVFDPY
jgi:hypothetical protein